MLWSCHESGMALFYAWFWVESVGADAAGEVITVHGKIEYGIGTNDVNGWLRWTGETPAQVISVAV